VAKRGDSLLGTGTFTDQIILLKYVVQEEVSEVKLSSFQTSFEEVALMFNNIRDLGMDGRKSGRSNECLNDKPNVECLFFPKEKGKLSLNCKWSGILRVFLRTTIVWLKVVSKIPLPHLPGLGRSLCSVPSSIMR
jgi:hypothetical protein